MSKLKSAALSLSLALLAPAGGAWAAVLGSDAAACAPGSNQPAVLVKVEGFKQHSGILRVQAYGGNPADFLAKGKKLRRIELPVEPAGPMQVCVALPAPGNYAIAVRHDVEGTGKSDWNDGGGFSRNPSLSLFALKPHYEDVVIAVGPAPRPIEIVLNYRQGLSIKPIKSLAR